MANQEQLAILKQGVQAWNQWQQEQGAIHRDLIRVDLRRVDLRHADLSHANLNGATLSHATLSEARVGWTVFGNVDLSVVKGLETVEHNWPSTIGIDTIYNSHGNIPEAFLKRAGVQESFLTNMRALVES